MLDDIKEKALKQEVPIIKDEGLLFLMEYIRKTGARRILELGTAVGYSSINMALLDKKIHIDTLERDPEMYEQALKNVHDLGLEEQISLHFGPIEEYMAEGVYDLIFVDAAKAQYGRYTEQFLNNLAEGGTFFYDNMIFHGLVLSEEPIKSRSLRSMIRKIRTFRDEVQRDERFSCTFYDNIGDGILILKRR